MEKYYRLFLNCSKVKTTSYSNGLYGHIEIFPQKDIITKKSFFGTKREQITKYNGSYNIIAEVKDDHFEDIILGKRIDYDPNGIQNITLASVEELESKLDEGITCYHFYEVDKEVALYYLEKIKSDPNVLEKYIKELDILEKKTIVREELIKRNESIKTSNEQLGTVKVRKIQNIKSA